MVFAIAVLGDSITDGYGVLNAFQRWPDFLTRAINANPELAGRVSVLNFGMGANFLTQSGEDQDSGVVRFERDVLSRPRIRYLVVLIGVGLTTVAWLAVTFLTPPADRRTLQRYYDRIHPYGKGWADVVDTSSGAPPAGGISVGLTGWFLGCGVVYSALFGTGYLLYGRPLSAAVAFAVAAASSVGLFRLLPRVRFD